MFEKVVDAVLVSENASWAVADALVEEIPTILLDGAQPHAFKDASHAIKEKTGRSYAPSHLKALWETARQFPPGTRIYNVPFAHYYETRVIDPATRAKALAEAEQNGWSKYKLRKAIGKNGTTPLKPESMEDEQVEAVFEAYPELVGEFAARNLTARKAYKQASSHNPNQQNRKPGPMAQLLEMLSDIILTDEARTIRKKAQDAKQSVLDGRTKGLSDEEKKAVSDRMRRTADTLSAAADDLKTAAVTITDPDLAKALND